MATILCIGAHPDDNEVSLGGTAAHLAHHGHNIVFVSVTNGNKGHYAPKYTAQPSALAARRDREARAAAQIINAQYRTLNIPDGEVYVTQHATEQMIRLIRSVGDPGEGPQLVLLNRPCDYHRDHRYTARLVLDATYMLTVPMICPDTPHLAQMPVFAYHEDSFTEEGPFRADVLVDIQPVFEHKIDMITAHQSQFFEWLPYNMQILDTIPQNPQAQRTWIAEHYRLQAQNTAQKHKNPRVAPTPPPTLAEAFQISEYGRQPTDEELAQLFEI